MTERCYDGQHSHIGRGEAWRDYQNNTFAGLMPA